MTATQLVVFPTEGKHLLEITREGPLFIMTMVDKENRFSPEMCKAICDALDHVAEVVDKEELTEAALMTRGQDKFYSNGLDMERAFSVPGFTDHTFMPMLNKILLFGIPTIACLNGYVLQLLRSVKESEQGGREGGERRDQYLCHDHLVPFNAS
jgi:enoyl-CoA hydratase/carnithine racemase